MDPSGTNRRGNITSALTTASFGRKLGRMRTLLLGLAGCLLAATTAAAQAADPQIVAPITKFMDTFNKGDMAGAAATHAPDAVIVDEVPPFFWRGPKAFADWGAALDADAKKIGMTEPAVALRAATRVETAGDQAYVIVPVTFTFKLKGVPMKEDAQMTFVLKKGASGWLIHSWTWTGPRPTPAK
jgi:ketosteroid isomerase-like protein